MENNILKKLLYFTFIDNFSISILWTGLPVLLYLMTESLIVSSVLFVTSSIARVIALFTSGYFIDRFSNKVIINICLCAMLINAALIYYFLLEQLYYPLFFAMILYQFFGSVSIAAKNIWYRNMVDDSVMVQSISRLSAYDKSAKTIGFTLGPLAFSLFNENTVLISICLLILCIVLVYITPYKVKKNSIDRGILEQYTEALYSIRNNNKMFLYTFVSVLIGVIGPTLLSLATYIIAERYMLIEEISLFWFASGVSVIMGNIWVSKMKNTFIGSRGYLVLLFILYCIGILLLTMAGSYTLFIIGFSMFTLGGPLVMNVVQSNIFIGTEPHLKGKVIGIIQALGDLGTLITIILSWWVIENMNIDYFLYCLFILSIMLVTTFSYTLHRVDTVKNKYTSE